MSLWNTFWSGVESLITLAYLEEDENKKRQHELELARIRAGEERFEEPTQEAEFTDINNESELRKEEDENIKRD